MNPRKYYSLMCFSIQSIFLGTHLPWFDKPQVEGDETVFYTHTIWVTDDEKMK